MQLAGQALSTEVIPVRVQLIAPPLYVMTTSCLDKVAGIDALTAAIGAVKAVIEARGGQLFVKMAVRGALSTICSGSGGRVALETALWRQHLHARDPGIRGLAVDTLHSHLTCPSHLPLLPARSPPSRPRQTSLS